MVQYKRKPVKLEPLPPFLDDGTEIWVIELTGEVFTDYERYLARLDFYAQKCFTCEATGRQGFTYQQALRSEMDASKEVNSHFPEVLRARVLEYVQFTHTPRMDDLVNLVFEHFRELFQVNDHVVVEHDNHRRTGRIMHISDTRSHLFPPGQSPDEFSRAFTYHITLDGSGEQISRYKSSDLSRDRRLYSKLILKQFLRSAVSREPWLGAPWKVREHLAKKYNIDTEVPATKTREAIHAAKHAAKTMSLPSPATTMTPGASPGQPTEQHPHAPTPPPVNGHGPPPPGSKLPGWHPGQATFVNFSSNNQPGFRIDAGKMGRPQLNGSNGPSHSLPFQHPHHPSINGRIPPFMPGQNGQLPPHLQHLNIPVSTTSGLPISLPFHHNFMQYQTIAPTAAPTQQQQQQHSQPPPPAVQRFEPVKYPMEDLEIKAPRGGERPPLKFFSDNVPKGHEPPEEKTGIAMKSVGPLLCAWDTLNVHDTIYALDSFTWDDFVEAICFSSEEIECELLIEIHCAVLKQIVDESGKLMVPLPSMDDSDDEEDDDEEQSSPEPVIEVKPARTTRSSLAKSEALAMVKRSPTPEPEQAKEVHKAAEFLAEFNWIERCKERNFRDGGWEAILVGLLYRLSFSHVEEQKEVCEEILAELVPADEEPSLESIAVRYVHLDVNLRIAALEQALLLTIGTENFRDQLTAAALEMTRLRKEKIEFQRKRRDLADELFKLDTERKIQLPNNMPASPPPESKENPDVSMTGTDDALDEADAVSESEEGQSKANRKLRHTKTHKRKREQEAARKAKQKKAKAEAAKTKQQKEWEKLLDDIQKKKEELRECESSIMELDDDLREANVHRSKLIGKDRFLNKYYWFEHNGMPFGGVPNSSTADYGYANGRLWVQGPDSEELAPNLEEPCLSMDREKFGFTIAERKEKEEGSTHLSNSTEWGFYDDPSDLDKLISWLDDRGVREKALRKELQAFRDRIAEYMGKMKEHLTEAEKVKAEGEDNSTRVSTRTKTYVDKDVTKDRCLLWTNSIMRTELGYSHCEEYEPPKKARKGTAKVTKAKKGKGRLK